MPGTESQQAFDLLDERFPQSNAQGAGPGSCSRPRTGSG